MNLPSPLAAPSDGLCQPAQSSFLNRLRMAVICALLLASALLTPIAAEAQPTPRGPAPLPVVAPPDITVYGFPPPINALRQPDPASAAATTTLLVAGAAAAGMSAALGAVIGYRVARHEGGEDPGISGAAGGWLAGPALVTPLVVHALNDRRGSLPLSYSLAAGIVLVSVVTRDAPIVFIASPALQAISAAIVQRSTER